MLKSGFKTYTKPGAFQSMFNLESAVIQRGPNYVVKNCKDLKKQTMLSVKMVDVTMYDGDHKKVGQIEIQLMNLCKKHPNILRIMSVFETPSHLMILTEAYPKKNLHDYLSEHGKMQRVEIREVMMQLLGAVKYMHHKNVVHRNVKLDTVLVSENLDLKLNDFSHASIVNSNTELKDPTGSLNYMAPELIKLILGRSEVGYGKPVDMWACGIILAYLITGNFLFWDESIPKMMQTISIVYINFKQPVWKDVEDDVKDLMQCCLRGEWEKRITAQDALSHPLFFRSKKSDVQKRKKNKTQFKSVALAVWAVFVMQGKAQSHARLRKVAKAFHIKKQRAYTIEYVRRANNKVALDLFEHWTGEFNKQKRVMLFQSSQKFITSRVKKTVK